MNPDLANMILGGLDPGYFDAEEERRRQEEAMRNKMQPPGAPPAPMPMPPGGPGVASAVLGNQGPPQIFDGYHGEDGLGSSYQPPQMGQRDFVPGAGYAMMTANGPLAIPHANDDMFNSRGLAPIARPWLDSDIEPTSVLGYSGSLRKASSPDTYGITRMNPNMPIFRAAQGQAMAGINAAGRNDEIARMLFQSQEGDKQRAAEMERLKLSLGIKDETAQTRAIKDLAEMPVGDTRTAAVARIKGLTPEQQIENAYGPALKGIKDASQLGALTQAVGANTDIPALANVLHNRLGITQQSIADAANDLNTRSWYNPMALFRGRDITTDQMTAEDRARYNLYLKLLGLPTQ